MKLFDGYDFSPVKAGREQKRFYTFYGAVFCMMFLLGAFTLWEFLFELCEMIGSIVEGMPYETIVVLKRMLPLMLTAFCEVYISVWTFYAFRAKTFEKRKKIWKVNGFVTIVWGAAISLYIVVGLFTKQYEHFVEGFPSALFPLDVCLGGLLFVLFGIMSVRYSEKQVSEGFYTCGVTGNFRVFHVLSYMIGICSFSAFVYGLFILDWAHEYYFFNVMVLLNYFAAFSQIIIYRFVYCHLTKESRVLTAKKTAICGLIINFVLFALYLLAVQLQNEAPNLNAFGIMPIDFTASFNGYSVIMGANNLIFPLVALIKSFFVKKER